MSDKPSSGGGGRRFPSSKWEEDFESYFIENDPVKAEAMNAHDRELASPETATPKNKSKGKGKQVTPASPATASSPKAPVAASTSDEESEDGEEDKRAEAARRWPDVKQHLADSTYLKSYAREGFKSKKDAQDFIAFRKKWFPLGGKSKKTLPSAAAKDNDDDDDMEVDDSVSASNPPSTGHSQHTKGKGKAPASRG